MEHKDPPSKRLAICTDPEDYTHQLDAIACGVAARLENLIDYGTVVNRKTILIAHTLGIPQSQIRRWLINKEKSAKPENGKGRLCKTRPALLSKAFSQVVEHLLDEPFE